MIMFSKMKFLEFFKLLILGALMGCFILALVECLIALSIGPENFILNGSDIINYTVGTIIVGFAFSLSSLIYSKEELPFVFRILIQMGFGMLVLFAVAIYLGWMPLNEGLNVIVTWISISLAFAVVCWIVFYIYYSQQAKEMNKRLKIINNEN